MQAGLANEGPQNRSDPMDNSSATPPAVTPELPQQEIDSGKTMAVLAYIPVAMIGLIVSIVVLVQKNNAYALYHAKQALTLFIVTLVACLACTPLLFICIGIPLLIAVEIGAIVLCVIGIVNASSGKCKPLPLIDKFATKMFGNIQKA
jgi:uncharacterized membrane protein